MASYLIDRLAGAAGSPLVGHTPDTGSTPWAAANNYSTSNLLLDGTGYLYNGASGSNSSLDVWPGSYGPAGSSYRIYRQFNFQSNTTANGNTPTAGVGFYTTGSSPTNRARFYYNLNSQSWVLSNGSGAGGSVAFPFPARGTIRVIAFDITDVPANGNTPASATITTLISSDNGSTFTSLFPATSLPVVSGDSGTFTIGEWFDVPNTATTGVLVGNLIVGAPGTAYSALPGMNPAATPTVTSVTVAPSSPTVAGSQTQQFTATVSGTNSPGQGVTWTASLGSITASGLYTAPAATIAAQSDTVTATSTVDTTKSGTATVTIPALPAVTSVTVAPATATVTGGNTQQFTATVNGTNGPGQSVTWTASTGTITSAGLWTAPAPNNASQTGTITATSSANSAKTGTATVTVPVANPPAAPTITVTQSGNNDIVSYTPGAAPAGSNPPTQFFFYSGNSAGGESTTASLTNSAAAAMTFSFPAAGHFYIVKAADANGLLSAASNEIQGAAVPTGGFNTTQISQFTSLVLPLQQGQLTIQTALTTLQNTVATLQSSQLTQAQSQAAATLAINGILTPAIMAGLTTLAADEAVSAQTTITTLVSQFVAAVPPVPTASTIAQAVGLVVANATAPSATDIATATINAYTAAFPDVKKATALVAGTYALSSDGQSYVNTDPRGNRIDSQPVAGRTQINP